MIDYDKAKEALQTIQDICKECKGCEGCPFILRSKEKSECGIKEQLPYEWKIRKVIKLME